MICSTIHFWTNVSEQVQTQIRFTHELFMLINDKAFIEIVEYMASLSFKKTNMICLYIIWSIGTITETSDSEMFTWKMRWKEGEGNEVSCILERV